jgi:formylglycine-generating enzyme required for sulfatase activity
MLENHWMNPRWQEVILLTAGELDQRGNKQALEIFLLHILHLDDAARGSLLAGRALADVGIRRVKDTITDGIRAALKHTMWDADTDGRLFAQARVPIDQRASAADTLDELGYLPADLYDFAPVGQISNLPYIAKHPVTNLQYKYFLESPDFADEKYWLDFPRFDENGQPMQETWGRQGLDWMQKALQDKDISPNGRVILPRYWTDPRFGIARRTAPVVGITWWEANAFCKWLTEHWQEIPEYAAQKKLLQGKIFRLPTENEWVLAAGGEAKDRYPWDEKGKATTDKDEILRRANTDESGINRTTPAGMYPLGRTTSGIWDMGGNVWEWQANFYDKDHDYLGLRGGSWDHALYFARVVARGHDLPYNLWVFGGFRLVVFSPPT